LKAIQKASIMPETIEINGKQFKAIYHAYVEDCFDNDKHIDGRFSVIYIPIDEIK